jgi:hypothetical protein
LTILRRLKPMQSKKWLTSLPSFGTRKKTGWTTVVIIDSIVGLAVLILVLLCANAAADHGSGLRASTSTLSRSCAISSMTSGVCESGALGLLGGLPVTRRR